MNINKINISVFIIWLVHIAGLIGLLYYDFSFFASLTPLNLTFMAILLAVNINKIQKKVIFSSFMIFLVGMVFEGLGVNLGLIFGSYEYGNNLGFKLYGVPLLIGLYWIVLTIISGNIAYFLFKKKSILAVVFGALLMVGMDLSLEPIAPILDLWKFDGASAPLSNYFGWFITGLITQTIFNLQFKKTELKISLNLYFAFLAFFIVLNILSPS